MNKAKYESTLRSIAHYATELEKLKQATEAVHDTRNELIKSLIEYFPFEKGDIIFCRETMYKVVLPVEGRLSHQQEPVAVVECQLQDSSNGFCNRSDRVSNTLENWLKFKKIN